MHLGSKHSKDEPSQKEFRGSDQRQLAERISARIKRQEGAPVRVGFLRHETPQADHPTPLASLVRSGRGSEARLKTYLTLLWMAVAEPYNVSESATTLAQLIGLEGNRARQQTNSSLDWLEKHRFIDVERRTGQPHNVFVLDERLSGEPYKRPGTDGSGPWIKLPNELWTHGWIASLSTPALATFLIMLDSSKVTKNFRQPVWLTRTHAKSRYSISDDTWYRGVKELQDNDLITTESKTNVVVAGQQRFRHEHSLHLMVMTESSPQATT